MDILDNIIFDEETQNFIEEQKTDYLDEVGEEIKTDEGLFESESDFSILSSNDINNVSSDQIVNLEEPIQNLSENKINYITYNYFYTVSEDSLSNNLINKQLSEYNTSESLAVLLLLMFLGIGFYLLIRRAVFKWR